MGCLPVETGFSFGGASRLGPRAGRIGLWMHEHPPIFHPDVERRDFLHERRRRRAAVRLVLVAVPRTGDAAENNFAFAERAVLVLADVRDGGDFSIVFENRHALTGEADDARAVFGNVGDGAGVNESLLFVAADVRRRILLIEHIRLLTSAAA